MTQQPDIPPTTVLFIDASKDQRTFWVEQLQRCSADYEILEASDMQSGWTSTGLDGSIAWC